MSDSLIFEAEPFEFSLRPDFTASHQGGRCRAASDLASETFEDAELWGELAIKRPAKAIGYGSASLTQVSNVPSTGLREMVSGFPTYSRSSTALPILERQKIDRLAAIIINNHNSAQAPIRTIRLIGHADMDTPRRPAFERQVALERAREVQAALARALERVGSGGGRPPQPPYSSRLSWQVESFGATVPVVATPRSEAERARNRRVEITLIPYTGLRSASVAMRTRFNIQSVGQTNLVTPSPKLDAVIKEFCALGLKRPNPKWCVEATASMMTALCTKFGKSDVPCQAPVKGGRCYTSWSGPQILDDIEYRAPFGPQRCCCDDTLQCQPPWDAKCGKCGIADGHYAVLKYKQGPLQQMINDMARRLDCGCAVPVGVMSGICDDKADRTSCPGWTAGRTCDDKNKSRKTWQVCWEHWLLVLGRDGDTFVFWDSALDSAFLECGHLFGLLFYDKAEDRLSTAPPGGGIDGLEVTPLGYHTQGFPIPVPGTRGQKRYQVVSVFPGLPWRTTNQPC